MEMVRQIGWGFRDAGSDDELEPGLVEGSEVAGLEHPGVSGDHHLDTGDVMAVLELPDHGHNGVGFGLVALETADLQRKPGPVDEQADHDLRINRCSFE